MVNAHVEMVVTVALCGRGDEVWKGAVRFRRGIERGNRAPERRSYAPAGRIAGEATALASACRAEARTSPGDAKRVAHENRITKHVARLREVARALSQRRDLATRGCLRASACPRSLARNVRSRRTGRPTRSRTGCGCISAQARGEAKKLRARLRVAVKLVERAVEGVRAGFRDDVDLRAAVAPERRIVGRGRPPVSNSRIPSTGVCTPNV